MGNSNQAPLQRHVRPCRTVFRDREATIRSHQNETAQTHRTFLGHLKVSENGIYIYGHRQNYGKNKTFNLDRRRLRPIFP